MNKDLMAQLFVTILMGLYPIALACGFDLAYEINLVFNFGEGIAAAKFIEITIFTSLFIFALWNSSIFALILSKFEPPASYT